jgi:hypothetical protein
MIEAIRERLAAMDPPLLRTIDTAAEYAALEAPPPAARCPAAYVIELADEATANALATGGTRQRLTERLGIVLVVASLRDGRGAAASAALRTVRQAVRAQLIGWPPGPDHDPLGYVSGALVGAERGYVVWQDVYVTRSTLRGPS